MRAGTGFVLLCLLVTTGCGGGGSGPNAQQPDTVTNSIVGTWEHVYPATQCIETNQFTENGEFTGRALDEVYSGSYSFQETVSAGERHELSIDVQEDNEQADCFGRNINSAGRSVIVFVVFTSPGNVEFWSRTTGGELIIDFSRVD